MHSICKLIFALTVAVIANGETPDPAANSNDARATEIYEFWQEQDKNFHLGDQKEVVLFLGNTGSGKSTTALFVTGAKLNATTIKLEEQKKQSAELANSDKSTGPRPNESSAKDSDEIVDIEPTSEPVKQSVDVDDIIIIDGKDKIGRETTKSKTLIPELFTDESGVAYYDCPGFEDTRSAEHELTIAFFLQKLLTYANSFKLVFVVDHSSLKTAGYRSDFTKMVDSAVKLIKNVEHYKEAIGLIVTKVNSDLEDAEVIQKVATFLIEVKKSLRENNGNEDSIRFIKALLVRSEQNGRQFYGKIGVFQRAKELGPLDGMPIFQQEQQYLKNMIYHNLKYVGKENNDFGKVISPKSKGYIVDLTKKIIDNGFGSDVEHVGSEIKEFYQKMESRTSDLSELYDKSELGYELLSAIQRDDPRQFLKEVLDATYKLGIAISNNTIDPILKHIESVDFLMTVDNQPLTNQLITEVDDIKKYLLNYQNWYKFLMDLEEELTNSVFQNDKMKAVARNIFNSLSSIQKEEITFNEIGLEPLLKKFANDEISSIKSISDSTITKSNLNALKNVLNEFINDKLDAACPSEPDMEAKGRVVKISDVIQDDCFSSAKNIKIFALKKLIVDKSIDKIGKQAQIVIIAPTWDIIGDISFNLDGVSGENHPNAYAPNGNAPESHYDNGNNGAPGLPGSAGGNFFAIGSKFSSEDHLTIQVNGGNGGAGQHGGKGTLGIQGENPPVPEDKCSVELEKLWDGQNFKYDRHMPGYSNAREYMVYGRSGTKAGDGGHGGKQGEPGLAGKILIFELDQIAHLKTYTINGTPGAIGRGGRGGGGETRNGDNYKVGANFPMAPAVEDAIPICIATKLETFLNGKNDAGKDGSDNTNEKDMEHAVAPLPFNHPLFAVNEYKSFAREHLVGSTRQTKINTFLNKLTTNETLKAEYGTSDLINEFTSMENQYFQLRGKIDLIPHLESLLNRTEALAEANKGKAEFSEQKRTLSYLYTAVLSKINGIKKKVFKNTVLDFNEFLEKVNHNINKLRDSIAQNNLIIVRNDFNSQLNEKIDSANQFIETQITPVVKQIFAEIDGQIKELISASIGKQKGVTSTIESRRDARNKLEANMRLRWALAPLKVVAAAATVLGPMGAAAGTAINTGTNMIQSLALKDVSVTDIGSTISTAFKDNMASLSNVLTTRPQLIQQKINDIDEYVRKNLADSDAGTVEAQTPSYDVVEIKKLKAEIKQSKSDIDKLNEDLTERIKSGKYDIPKDLMEKCDQIEGKLQIATTRVKENLENQKKQLSNDKKAQEEMFKEPLRIIGHVQNVVKIVDVSLQTYKEICEDDEKLQVVSATIATLENDLKVLKDHETKIHTTLIPQIGKMQNDIDEMKNNLAGNSHAQLDVKKWNIRTALSDVRLLFSRMTKDFGSVNENLKSCIDKLDEGMATLINVYDRIDSYSDTAKLASYIKNIASHEVDINGTKLSEDLTKLKQVIQSNIVLEEYELAMHALKQHYFPNVNSFMAESELPENLQMTDTQSIVKDSIARIEDITEKIKSEKISYDPNGHYIYPLAPFDGRSRWQPPFYTWRSHEHKNQIKNLLEGNKITLKADVTRGVSKNAIAFNNIGIRFKFPNVTLQNELNDMLQQNNVRVKMSMVGTSYYRCNNRYYQIPLDQDMVFNVHFEKNIDVKPLYPDATFGMILSNPAFLSPYTMWTMELMDADHLDLQQFANLALDMELIGIGRYIENGPYANQICNDQLDKYYTFDETISNVNTLMQTKLLKY